MATKEWSVEVTPSANIEIRSLPSESLREEALEAIVDLGEDPTPPQASLCVASLITTGLPSDIAGITASSTKLCRGGILSGSSVFATELTRTAGCSPRLSAAKPRIREKRWIRATRPTSGEPANPQ